MTWKEFLDGRKFTAKERGVLMPGQRVGRVTLTGWYFRWVAQNLPETTFYQFLRMLEVPAIIVALVAFWIDYADRPIDRATRNAQLLAQVAQLATIEHNNASGGIKAILEFLADEDVSMRGIALERTKLSGVDLEGAHLRSVDFTRAVLSVANLTGANLIGAKLLGANLLGAKLRGANLTGANLTDADLSFADLAGANLTNTVVAQDQLDSACISKGGEPPTLHEDLKPPQNECGQWRRLTRP